MSRARLAERLWAASGADRVLLHELQDDWEVRGDVRDALWWRAHPLTDTPDGAPDPDVAFRALQTTVYSRDGATHGTAADEERLQTLTQERTERARALDGLLDHYAEWDGDRANGDQHVVLADLVGDTRTPPRIENDPRPQRRHPLLLVGVGVLLGVLGTVGVRALQMPENSADSPVVDTAIPEPARDLPFAATRADTGLPEPVGVFQVFARPPLFVDGAPALWSNVVLDSVREVDTFYSFQTYVGRNSDGEYCGLIRQTGRFGGGVACRSEAALRTHGLSMGAVLPAKDGDPDYPAYIDVRFTWRTDGTFHVDMAPADHP